MRTIARITHNGGCFGRDARNDVHFNSGNIQVSIGFSKSGSVFLFHVGIAMILQISIVPRKLYIFLRGLTIPILTILEFINDLNYPFCLYRFEIITNSKFQYSFFKRNNNRFS